MNNCLRGRELLLDLQRSDFLPPWDDEGIRTVSNEMTDMYSKLMKINDIYTNFNEATNDTAKAYYGLCIMRNRRYLFSYVINRLKKISHLRWELGTVLPDAISHDILSIRENTFYSKYSDILSEYMVATGIDLTADLEPPKELFIEVRALENCGEIMTENGPINIIKDSTHFVRRTDVEFLILQGKLKHVDSGDS